MKNLFLALLLLVSHAVFAQTNEIVKLLNQQFEAEQTMYDPDYDPEKPTIIQPFQIKNDTLSVVISIPYEIEEEKNRIFQRAVHLKDITGFIKDMNVLFTAKDGSVKETVIRKDKNGHTLRTDTSYSHLFFTELKKDGNNESLKRKMIKAFKKAGYDITSAYWYN